MNTMKSIKFLAFALSALVFTQCADSLDVSNENEPPLEVLQSEEGLKRASLGIWFFDDGQRISDFNWLAQTNHSIMGDETYVPWGNFGWRWANQLTSITYNGGTETWTPPEGGPQGDMLAQFNDRAQVDNNALSFEWRAMYRANNSANLILENVDAVDFSGDAAAKRSAHTAWARFWKGWAYSRIGAMYSNGLIINEYGSTNGDYLPNTAILAEAEVQFDQALTALSASSAAWDDFVASAIPDYMQVGNGTPTVADMTAMINTMRARNILIMRRAFPIATGTLPEITTEDYNRILALTANGLQEGSNWIQFRTISANGVFFQTIWPPYRALIGWAFMSERLVQDFKPGDARLTRNVDTLATPQVNRSGRGIQYGTRYQFKSIDAGGDYASTTDGLMSVAMAGSWIENALMRAEALIRTGAIEDGLNIIDAVRASQNAGLDPVAGTGLNEDQAYEELRRERRIGLIFQGLQFYDARRWAVTVPTSLGGGRENGVILDGLGVLHEDATLNYNYLDFWGVPDDELDFNETDRASVSNVGPM